MGGARLPVVRGAEARPERARGRDPLAGRPRPIAEAEAADQFRAGFLVGEVTTQTRINLLGPALDLPDGDGLAGPSRSAELWLEPSPDGDTLSMRGVAARDGVVIPFRAGMTIDERWVSQPDDNPVLLRRLRGILWDAELVDGGTLTLGVDPRRWLDGADFSTLAEAPADSDGTRPVTPDGPVGRTIYARSRRIGPTGPWSFTWQPPEAP